MDTVNTTAIELAIDKAGSQSALAAGLGITRQAINFWKQGHALVPIPHVLVMEQKYGVPREQFRPDVYPKEPAGVVE